MQQVKPEKPTLEVLNNQKQISKNIHKRTLKAIKGIVEFCTKSQIKDGQNAKVLFKQVNQYSLDLTNVISYMQQIVIDIGNRNSPSVNNLEYVLGELSTITSDIQEALKMQPEAMKNKMQIISVVVSLQSEKFVKIIELDDSHEYKQRILDCQLDFVIYTEKLTIGMQCINLTLAKIVKRAHDLVANFSSLLIKIKTDRSVVEEDFSHYVRRNIQHIQYIIDYMSQLRSTGCCAGILDETLIITEKSAKVFMNEMIEALMESDHSSQKFLTNIEKCQDIITTISNEFKNGISKVDKTDDKKVQELAQEINHYLFTAGLHILQSVNNTVEDVITKN